MALYTIMSLLTVESKLYTVHGSQSPNMRVGDHIDFEDFVIALQYSSFAAKIE